MIDAYTAIARGLIRTHRKMRTKSLPLFQDSRYQELMRLFNRELDAMADINTPKMMEIFNREYLLNVHEISKNR